MTVNANGNGNGNNPPPNQLRQPNNSDDGVEGELEFPVSVNSVESAFQTLNLSGGPVPTPSNLGHGENGSDFFQWLRVRDAVNGQINGQISDQIYPSRVGQNPTAGMLPACWTYPAAEIYPREDLMSKQPYVGFDGSPVASFPRRREITSVDPYGAIGYNRPRPMDLLHVPLRYLRGNIANLAKNQRGCRVLQANLEGPTEEEIDWVLAEVLYHVEAIMCDQFGNYVFQKVVKVANETQRTHIAMVLSTNPFQLINICRNPHGTRAVQKFLENINTHQQIGLVMSALCLGAVALSSDPNGHHVMQHCLKRFPFEYNEYLIYEMTINCFEISTSKSGCCVMQTCVDFSRGKSRKDLIFEIISNVVHLAEDPYGNYVVQHLLDLKTHEVTDDLLRQLKGYHLALSCNKYASNVVQKCMEETDDEYSKSVIIECLTSPHLSRLLNDPFGNYVVQTALKRFKGPILKNLLNIIRQNAASMRNNMYGKKILDLIQEMKLWRI